jgi:hypothetical protein
VKSEVEKQKVREEREKRGKRESEKEKRMRLTPSSPLPSFFVSLSLNSKHHQGTNLLCIWTAQPRRTIHQFGRLEPYPQLGTIDGFRPQLAIGAF